MQTQKDKLNIKHDKTQTLGRYFYSVEQTK